MLEFAIEDPDGNLPGFGDELEKERRCDLRNHLSKFCKHVTMT
jgi:hypothetical protein